jgi:hypothetical protein
MSIQLKKHQEICVAYMKTHRGLLLYHSTGSGKTLTSLYSMYQHPEPIIVVGTKSSRKAFMDSLVLGNFDEKRLTFYTYAKIKKELETSVTKFKDKSIILDEAHNIRSENLHNLYIQSALGMAKRVMLLTATPVVNYMNDLSVLVNSVKGEDVLPTDRRLFDHMFYDEVSIKFENANLFISKVQGAISYYKADESDDYPKTTTTEIEVPMNYDQLNEYAYYVSKVIYEGRTIANLQDMLNIDYAALPSKKKNFFLNVTRQLSNTYKNTNHSPKIDAIVEKLEQGPFPAIVYSNFLPSGIYPVASRLVELNISYETITGLTTSDKLQRVVDNYNAGLYKVLFISSAGSESLDLKNTRQFHIMEPHWNDAKIRQALGRANRYKSHSNLPENQRYIEIYKWISVFPPTIKNTTADQYLTLLANRKQEVWNQFQELVMDASIEKLSSNILLRGGKSVHNKNLIDPIDSIENTIKKFMNLEFGQSLELDSKLEKHKLKILNRRLGALFYAEEVRPDYVWRKVETNIHKEYNIYRNSKLLLKYTSAAILERWFILRANGEDADKFIIDTLIQDFTPKQEAISIANKMYKLMRKPQTFSSYFPNSTKIEVSKQEHNLIKFSYDKFECTLPTERYDILTRESIKRGSKNSDQDIGLMLMRYVSTFGFYRQFALNLKLYQKLVDNGATIEGFASPFNAQILQTKSDHVLQFCSLYPDTDQIFGSVGSFFYGNFANRNVALFPPTIEEILNKTAEKIINELDSHTCTFQIVLPQWEDLSAYIQLSQSANLKSKQVIDSDKYPSINPFTGLEHKSNRRFVLFVLKS